MTPMDRKMWSAVLAKLVAPMEPERAAKAIAAMTVALSYPAEAFTLDSAREVCSTGRILPDGETAPLTRVPTFGEIDMALGRWWRKRREHAAYVAQPKAREALPAPEKKGPTDAEKDAVSATVQGLVTEIAAGQPGAPPKPKVQSRYLSEGALLETYRRMADDPLQPDEVRRSARTRAEYLTARIGAAA